jgi:hypothetical protein
MRETKKRRGMGNGFLWGLLVAFGLIMMSSYGALQYQLAGGEIPFIAASLAPLDGRFDDVPQNQIRRLQFGNIPIESESVHSVSVSGAQVYDLELALTTADLVSASESLRESLFNAYLKDYDMEEYLTTFVEGSELVYREESSLSVGEEADSFEYEFAGGGKIVAVSWDLIYAHLDSEYAMTKEMLHGGGFKVEQFRVEERDGVYTGDLSLVSLAEKDSEVLMPE